MQLRKDVRVYGHHCMHACFRIFAPPQPFEVFIHSSMYTIFLSLLLLCNLVFVFSQPIDDIEYNYQDERYEKGVYNGDVIPYPFIEPPVLPHGFGKMTSNNGDVYIGHWVKGERNGIGKMTWYKDLIIHYYHGEFQNNFRHGRGFNNVTNGETCETYLGNFKLGKKSGDGVNTCTVDGKISKYSGKFQDDLPHGTGVLIDFDGLIYHGTWVNGRKDGQFVVVSEHIGYEWRLECSYSNDLLQGKAKMIYANGDRVEEIQFWDEGRRHGEQIIKYLDGRVEIQEWNHGLRHGKQEIAYLNGLVETQKWENDDHVGVMMKHKHYVWGNDEPVEPPSHRPLKRSRAVDFN